MHRHPYRMKILAYLARESLSIAEFNVIHFAHYASCPPVTMIRMAHAESLGSRVWPTSSRRACRDAVASLMTKGLLQLIDDAALGRIEAEMIAEPAFGPIDGLPQLGDLDFTKEGATFWRQIRRELFEWDEAKHWTGLGDADSEEFFATSESTLRRLIDDEWRRSGREILSVSDIVEIGPWRDRWWDVIMHQGFRATVTYGLMLDED
jgi:hypothetical protein